MANKSDFKKETTGICHYCDYSCRKGHKCSWFKRFVKTFKKCRHNTPLETDEVDKKLFRVTIEDRVFNETYQRLISAYSKTEAVEKMEEKIGTKGNRNWYVIQEVREVIEND